MPCNIRHEDSHRVSMTRRATSACPLPVVPASPSMKTLSQGLTHMTSSPICTPWPAVDTAVRLYACVRVCSRLCSRRHTCDSCGCGSSLKTSRKESPLGTTHTNELVCSRQSGYRHWHLPSNSHHGQANGLILRDDSAIGSSGTATGGLVPSAATDAMGLPERILARCRRMSTRVRPHLLSCGADG